MTQRPSGVPDAASSLATLRKDITIEVYNHQGQKVLAYNVFRCWVSEYQALPDLDANANAIGHERPHDRDTAIAQRAVSG
jgi:phage tail-like protein